jgi:Bacterial capsule synthesis protein PGA_cap
MLVWKDQHRAPVCRFGITGDFLPASGLSPVGGETWSEKGKLVAPLFQDLQFSIVNLECPVGVEGIAPKAKASLGDSFATRTESLEYLDSLKLSVVAIANNHLYDYGKAGAERTLLNVQGKFSVCGFGRTLQEPPSVCIREVAESIRVGIWAAARNLPDAATHNSMGIEPATRERAAQALAYMAGCNVHCHVAFLHAGAEGTNYPDPEDAEFMVELAEMGFDIVAACHSHKTVRGKNGAPGHSCSDSEAYHQAFFTRYLSTRASSPRFRSMQAALSVNLTRGRSVSMNAGGEPFPRLNNTPQFSNAFKRSPHPFKTEAIARRFTATYRET